ncbi:hypothetical protein MTR_1g015677 [Medicago truncatula]|uniref:Uncharacterized protein n=1 Tax=Medicago truncatula TaxID=3880 RepID=A0A072VES4_MEDTR|nr:hypothetical protein MTR_1g015677 [Medicago truncatula]
MASKRSGKEVATSSRGPPPKKQVPANNHGIIFKDNKQKDRYKNLISKPLHPCRMNFDNPNHRISFRLMNIDYEMSLQHFCDEMSFANAGFIHDSWDQSLKPVDYQPATFWEHITDLRQFNTRSNKASHIHNPVLRFDSRGEIVVGGIITYLARQLGVGEDQGITKIEGSNRLNIETLIFMNFIKPRPPMSYTLKLNVSILIILSNPSRTNTKVHEEHDNEGEEDAHLHQEEEGAQLHHDAG